MNSRHNVGNAGEFYVLAQLAQRGYIAGKTDDGQTMIDVIATDPESLRAVNIQVKTRTGEGDGWLMSQKNETPHDSLWYLLVQLNGASQLPDFYVAHSQVVAPRIRDAHKDWLSEPKRNGDPRQDSSMRRFRPTEQELTDGKDAWEQMFR